MEYHTKWIASILYGEVHPSTPGREGGGGGLSHLNGIQYEMDCFNNLRGSPPIHAGWGGGGLSHLDGIQYEMDCLNNLRGSPPIHAGQGGGRFVSFGWNTIRNGLPQ